MKKNQPAGPSRARRDTEFSGSLTPDVDGGERSAPHEDRGAAGQRKASGKERPCDRH